MKKIIIFFLLVLFISVLFNNNVSAMIPQKKDPFLGGVLSWYMPGLGQFYADRYLRGAVFWMIENTLFFSAVLTVADLNFSTNEEIGFQFNVKPKDTLSKKQERIGIGLFVGYAIFHIYNVIDAIQVVKEYNQDLNTQARLSLGYINVADNNFCSLNYKF
jgi:TM2 domain-containing membrane protein YozV